MTYRFSTALPAAPLVSGFDPSYFRRLLQQQQQQQASEASRAVSASREQGHAGMDSRAAEGDEHRLKPDCCPRCERVHSLMPLLRAQELPEMSPNYMQEQAIQGLTSNKDTELAQGLLYSGDEQKGSTRW